MQTKQKVLELKQLLLVLRAGDSVLMIARLLGNNFTKLRSYSRLSYLHTSSYHIEQICIVGNDSRLQRNGTSSFMMRGLPQYFTTWPLFM